MELSKIYIVFIFIFSNSFNLAQEISFPEERHKRCRTSSGERGFCLPFNRCRYARETVRRGLTPAHCHFRGSTPIVCCRLLGLEDENLSERITKLDVEPPNVNFACGIRGTVSVITNSSGNLIRRSVNSVPLRENILQFTRVKRSLDNFNDNLEFKRVKREEEHTVKVFVIGGKKARKNSWPWMALLGRKDGTETKFFCSAILINENFVVTAAHCVLSLDPFFVRLGEHDYGLGFGKPVSNTVEDVGVAKILFHPNFVLNQGYHDVALIKLNTSITIKNETSPICLPWKGLSFDELLGQQVTVAGWGRLSFGGVPSTVLQEVNVTVFDSSVCQKSYSTLSDFKDVFPQGMSNENVLCAGDANGKKDSCEGDSGGPIMYFSSEDKVYYLAGVISKGFGCGLKDFPGLYSPVRDTETLEWIKNNAF